MDAGRVEGDELPFGYRFHPTSMEVVEYYLKPKMRGEPLPSRYIKDVDVYRFDPDQLPIDQSKHGREKETYFFVPVPKELSQGVDNFTRSTPNGYWKVIEDNITLYGPEGAIGYQNKLEFYQGKDPNGIKTDWKMVEYRTNYRVNGNVESLMVCKLRYKVKAEEIYEEEGREASSEDENGGDGA